MSELGLRLDIQDVTSTNGVLMWKVDDFARRQREAMSGKTHSLYSPPFYTSPAGYKMCARIYLNGDGIGKSTHLSMFFVLMRGEFDALLQWPFRQKVTLMLLDQNQSNSPPRHVIETFRPDISSSSFQRPQQEMNIACGCPMFLPLECVQDSSYVKDDTICLKIIVAPGEAATKPP